MRRSRSFGFSLAFGLACAAFAADGGEAPAPGTKRAAAPAAGVAIVSSSHQDIAWMDSPQKCAEYRDVQVITPALEMMAKDPAYRFTMENMLNLAEYLERHPERRAEVERYTREGRLEWGATYNQPYESLLTGEQLVRETYFGRRWLRRTFPGSDARVAFNPDVPGRSLQSAQVFAKAGIPYLLISRFHEGLWRWGSPDGSSVLAFSPGHYGNAAAFLNAPPGEAVAAIEGRLRDWAGRVAALGVPPVLPLLNSVDFSKPTDFGPLIRAWNAGGTGATPRPAMGYSSARAFFEALDVPGARPPLVAGERPGLWLYIHGPTHHRAIDAQREAGWTLPAAEAFSAFRMALGRDPAGYPARRLDEAWKAAIFPDHGWGGKEGQITDRLFRETYERARDEGRAVLDDAAAALAARVKAPDADGTPVVVFNPLSWTRTAPVAIEVPRGGGGVRLRDAAGREVPCQVPPAGPDAETLRVEFVAEDVPGLGWGTWSLRRDAAAPLSGDGAAAGGAAATVVENDFYRMELAPGGVKSLYDKALGRETLATGKFLGFEVFTMRSVGNGAGEFGRVQQPDMEGFDKLSLHGPAWRIDAARSGPVKTVVVFEQPLEHATVRETLSLYRAVKRIDCEVELLDWDGDPYREFRLAVPVAAPGGRVAYEVPMGVVEVGASEAKTTGGPAYGTLVYDQEFADIRPREVGRFLGAWGGGLGVTISPSVAVCDYADPTPDPAGHPVLQPVLLASRRSCHGEGNWYLQEGDHRFRTSFTSHADDWREGYRPAAGANVPLVAVVRDGTSASPRAPDLPASGSFLWVDAPNVLVSAVKKAEDDDGIVVRLYEIEGRDTAVEVRTSLPLAKVEATDLIEENGRPIPAGRSSFRVKVGKYAIETYKLRLE